MTFSQNGKSAHQNGDIKIISNEKSLKSDPKTDWRSIYMLASFCLFDGIQYSMFIVSLWPYLNTVDPSAGASIFGIITAGFSFGQAIGSPILGFWMNKTKSIMQPMIASLIIQILSNVIYGFMENFYTTDRRWIMLASRILVGLGSGNVAVMRAYAANASVPKDRARAITMISASWVFYCIKPTIFRSPASPSALDYKSLILQLAILGGNFLDFFISTWLVEYTAPAALAAILNIVALVLLIALLKEDYVGVATEQKKEDPLFALPTPKPIPIFVLILTRFTIMFVITNNESIGSMFTMAMYEWTNAEAVKYNGFIQLAQAGLSMTMNILFFWKLANYISRDRERKAAILGLSLVMVYHIVTFAWPFWPDKLGSRVEYDSGNSTEIVGCYTSKYSWCSYTHQIPMWLYICVYVSILGLGFPLTFMPINTFFSKVLGDRRQGTMTGVFFMSGSIARTIGPIIISIMFEKLGPEVTWAMQIGIILLTIIMWIVFYRQIVPLDPNPKLKPGQYYRYDRGVKYYF